MNYLKYDYKPHIDLTSLVDVIFILLTFLFISTSMNIEAFFSVQLPKSKYGTNKHKRYISIIIDKKNSIYINNKHITLKQLPKILKQQYIKML